MTVPSAEPPSTIPDLETLDALLRSMRLREYEEIVLREAIEWMRKPQESAEMVECLTREVAVLREDVRGAFVMGIMLGLFVCAALGLLLLVVM
jgi:hypothetical protein